MFCGQCGRAITTADVAAFKAARDAQKPAASPEIPAWTLQEPPAASVPAGTPWWLADDRSADRADKEAAAPAPAPASAQPPLPEPSTGDVTTSQTAAPDSAPAEIEPTDSALVAADSSADADSGDDEVTPPGARTDNDAPSPEVASPPVTPLRLPGRQTAASERPTSAPLWTASLTPVDRDPVAEASSDHESRAEVSSADESRGHESSDDWSGAPDSSEPTPGDLITDGVPAREQQSDGSPTAEVSESDSGSEAGAAAGDEPDRSSTGSEASVVSTEPTAGDTNVIPPLVAPSRAGEGGQLRCTVCGAALGTDDIFCGECGTVVASVAQSFTGPITPVLTGVVPSSDAPPAASVGRQPVAESTVEERREVHPEAAAEETAGSSPAASTEAAEVVDPPKRRRLFGRRAASESPQLWSTASTPAAPVSSPAAPETVPAPPVEPRAAPPTPAGAASPPPELVPRPPVSVGEVPVVDELPPAAEPTQAPLSATPVDAPQQTVAPVMAPLPPAPESPRRAQPWSVGVGEDDIEQTRIVRPRPLGEPFVLQFSTGDSFTVQGTGLVGRAPTPQPGEAIDLLVRIVDPGKSVSKTHLEFGQDDGALWVSDRWSGNGTIVRPPSEAAVRCDAGRRVRVPRGSRVDIGEQFFIVS